MLEASITGFFRTILLFIGAFVLLKFIGRDLILKRARNLQNIQDEEELVFQQQKKQVFKNKGKTSLINHKEQQKALDIEYEEII